MLKSNAPRTHRFLKFMLVAVGLLPLAGCWSDSPEQVVVYAALDAEFSRPIFAEFEQATGIDVREKFDVESTKTVGLTEAILAESARPRCDVFWNNEILHTLRLQKAGLLEVYRPAHADAFPESAKSPRGQWHGFAARARVLIVNTDSVKADAMPNSILDLVDPKWQGRVGIAKPLFGTTATHAACLFVAWGDERAKQFFEQLQENAQIMSGNKRVAQAVAAGQLDWGLTDTDDAIIELEQGMPVTIVYPDQQPDQLGTLFIPNTLALIKGGPHPEAARRLIDYLLTVEVENRLAAGPSAQIPLHPQAAAQQRVETPKTVRPMEVDFSAASDRWDEVSRWLRDTLTARP